MAISSDNWLSSLETMQEMFTSVFKVLDKARIMK